MPKASDSFSMTCDPALPYIRVRSSEYESCRFKKHTHETYSIGLVEAGATTFECGSSTMAVGAGDLVFIHPEEVHACNPGADTPWRYKMFYIDADWMAALATEMGITSIGPPVFRVPHDRHPQLFEDLKSLAELIEGAGSRLEKESCVLSVISRLISLYGAPSGKPSPSFAVHPGVTRAREHIREHLFENIALSDLAEVAGLSAWHFLRTFKAEVGMPPHAFQNEQRIRHAKTLLEAGTSLVDTALATGFYDQSHFSRKFKAHVGVTPRRYQRAFV